MNEFDLWREKYDTMTYKEQVEYYNDIESRYPEQAHYNYSFVSKCFEAVGTESKVLEFGTWKGDLAQLCIPQFNIKKWLGIEICKSAIEKTNCNHSEFSYWFPKDFNWFETTKRDEQYNFVIATHFIEHLNDSHFDSLVDYCSGVKYIYFEAPLNNDPQNWQGYQGTHKLNYGWNQIIEKLGNKGYLLHLDFGDGKFFKLNEVAQ